MPPLMYEGPGIELVISVDDETYSLRKDVPQDVPQSVIDAAQELEDERVTTDVEVPEPEPETESPEVPPGEPIDPDGEPEDENQAG